MIQSPFDQEPFAGCLRLGGVRPGAGPAFSAYFEIVAVREGQHTQLWYWDDDLMVPEPLLAPIEGTATARNVARALAEEGDLQLVFSADDLWVNGATGAGAELLALAASQGRHDKRIARLLSVLDDLALEQLYASDGPFLGGDFEREVSHIAETAWEEDLDLESLAAEVRGRSSMQPVSLVVLANAVTMAAEAAREQESRRRLREEEQLAPYVAGISAIVEEWRRRRIARSSVEHRVRDMISSQLRGYLRAYVLQHQELPTGVHEISGHGYTSSSTMVDFDSLRGPVQQ